MSEIRLALEQLKNNKAPGDDSITTKLLKAGGIPILKQLQELFDAVIRSGTTPKVVQYVNVQSCQICEHCQCPVINPALREGFNYHMECLKCYVCSETDLHSAEVFKGVIFCRGCSQRIFQGCLTARSWICKDKSRSRLLTSREQWSSSKREDRRRQKDSRVITSNSSSQSDEKIKKSSTSDGRRQKDRRVITQMAIHSTSSSQSDKKIKKSSTSDGRRQKDTRLITQMAIHSTSSTQSDKKIKKSSTSDGRRQKNSRVITQMAIHSTSSSQSDEKIKKPSSSNGRRQKDSRVIEQIAVHYTSISQSHEKIKKSRSNYNQTFLFKLKRDEKTKKSSYSDNRTSSFKWLSDEKIKELRSNDNQTSFFKWESDEKTKKSSSNDNRTSFFRGASHEKTLKSSSSDNLNPFNKGESDEKTKKSEMGVVTDLTQQLLLELCSAIALKRSTKPSSLSRHEFKTIKKYHKKELIDLRVAELGASTEMAHVELKMKEDPPVIIKSLISLCQEARVSSQTLKTLSYDTTKTSNDCEHCLDSENSSYRSTLLFLGYRFASLLKIPYIYFKKNVLERNSALSIHKGSYDDIESFLETLRGKRYRKNMSYKEFTKCHKRGLQLLYPTIQRRKRRHRMGWLELSDNNSRRSITLSRMNHGNKNVSIGCKHYRRSYSYRCMRSHVMKHAGPTERELAVYRSILRRILFPTFLKTPAIEYPQRMNQAIATETEMWRYCEK